MMKSVSFEHGQLLGAAMAVLATYSHMARVNSCQYPLADSFNELLDVQVEEMLRLANNVIQLRNDWGDPIQLAGLIVFMIENVRSTALDA